METTLAPTVYLPTQQLLKEFKISLSTLRRSTQLLRETLPASIFDKGYCEEGYSLKSYQVLKVFFALRRQSMPPHKCAEYILLNSKKGA